MHVFEVRHAELMESLTTQAAEQGITSAAIVALIGAVDSFTVSTNPAAAVAVVAIMVTVAARIIVDGRGVPPSPVRVVADHVRVVRIVTVGVAVVLLLRQVVPRAPKLLRSILSGCAPLSDYRERDHYNDSEA